MFRYSTKGAVTTEIRTRLTWKARGSGHTFRAPFANFQFESECEMPDHGRRLRVYMVEDSAILRGRLLELLDPTGVEVVGCSDTAPAAIRDITAAEPDVVVVDIALRQGTGFDVVRALDLAADGPHPTTIVLSNYDTAPYRQAARRLGVTHYFEKSRGVFALLRLLSSMAHAIGLGKGSKR